MVKVTDTEAKRQVCVRARAQEETDIKLFDEASTQWMAICCWSEC